MKTFFKKAVDAYLVSDEGAAACDPVTISAPARNRQYLENRIKQAFAAGWNAGTEHHGVDTDSPVSEPGESP